MPNGLLLRCFNRHLAALNALSSSACLIVLVLLSIINSANAADLTRYYPALSRAMTYACKEYSRIGPPIPDTYGRGFVTTYFTSGPNAFDVTQKTISLSDGSSDETIYDTLGRYGRKSQSIYPLSTRSTVFTPPLNYIPSTGDTGTTYDTSGTFDTWIIVTNSADGSIVSETPAAGTYIANGKVLASNKTKTVVGEFDVYSFELNYSLLYNGETNASRVKETYLLGKDIGILGYKSYFTIDNNPLILTTEECGVIDLGSTEPNDAKDDGDADDCSKYATNPINVATGNSYKSHIDYEAAQGLLKWQRLYNSRAPLLSSLGYGWRHNYDHHLVFISNLQPTRRVVMLRADGKVLAFKEPGTTLGGAGNWVGDADVNARLIPVYSPGLGTTPTGWRYLNERDEVETYDSYGRLLQISTATGQNLSLVYGLSSTPELPTSITDNFGRQLSLSYNSEGRITQVTDPAGQTIDYTYDVDLNLATVTYPDTKIRSYRYNEQLRTAGTAQPHALTSILDENSVEYKSWEFDAQGRAIAYQAAGGVDRTTLSYAATTTNATTGLISGSTTVTDGLNTPRSVAYNKVLGVTKPTAMSASCNHTIRGGDAARVYDASGNITSRSDFNGNRTCYALDARNLETLSVSGFTSAQSCPANLVTYVSPAATAIVAIRKISSQWHPDWRMKVRKAEPKLITTFVYNGQPDPTAANALASCAPTTALVDGKPIAVLCKKVEQPTTDETGGAGFGAAALAAASGGTPRVWSYTYNAEGQMPTANGPRTDVTDLTTVTYHPATTVDVTRGDIATVANAVGHTNASAKYNKRGQVLSMTDANNIKTDYTYHPRGWLTSATVTPAGGATAANPAQITTYAYDGVGQMTKATQPDGSFLTYTYNAAHRLTDITDSLGNTVHYTLDSLGNRVKEEMKGTSGTLKRNIARAYNTLNRLQSVTGSVQ
jgi:YD repeat-containing protein